MRAFDNFYLPMWLRGILQLNLKDEWYDNDRALNGIKYSMVRSKHKQADGKYKPLAFNGIKAKLEEEPGKTRRATFPHRYRSINGNAYWLGTNQLMGALSPFGAMWQDFKRAFRRSDSKKDTAVELFQVVRGLANIVIAPVVAVTGLGLLVFDLVALPLRLLAAPLRSTLKKPKYQLYENGAGYEDGAGSENNNPKRFESLKNYLSRVANHVSNAVAAVWRDASYLLFSVALAIRGITQIVAAPLVIGLQWPFQRFLRCCHNDEYRSFKEKSSTKKYMKEMSYHLEQVAVSLLDKDQKTRYDSADLAGKREVLQNKLNTFKENQDLEKNDFRRLVQNYDAEEKGLWARFRHPHGFESLFLELESKAYKAKEWRGQHVPEVKATQKGQNDNDPARITLKEEPAPMPETATGVLAFVQSWHTQKNYESWNAKWILDSGSDGKVGNVVVSLLNAASAG